MSIKNIPLTAYLDSKALVRSAVLAEIRVQKENVMNLEIAAYEEQLSEEIVLAVDKFLQANITPEEDFSLSPELEEKKRLLIEQLQQENAAKVRQLTTRLTKKLNTEIVSLRAAGMSDLILQHTGPVTAARLNAVIEDFLKRFRDSPHFFTFLLKREKATFFELTTFANKLYINAFMDPRFVLFLSRVAGTSLRLHEKFRKVRSKKFKMKRRKVRKLYVFRKLKKIILFRKLKKRYFTRIAHNTLFANLGLRTGSKNLIKRIPVSTRVIEATAVEFFYKLNKKFNHHLVEDFAPIDEEVTDFLIYLRNYHQKPYFKFRKARIAHWRLFFNKTLRQQRYKGFLRRFMKKYEQLSYTLNFLVNFFTKVKLSWSRCSKLESFFKLYIIEYTNSIVRIPLIFMNFFK